MNINDLKEFGVYAYNDESEQTIFVEVLKVYTNERKAKVSLYKSFDSELIEIVSTENISPISITESILKALSFEEVTGQLYGVLAWLVLTPEEPQKVKKYEKRQTLFTHV